MQWPVHSSEFLQVLPASAYGIAIEPLTAFTFALCLGFDLVALGALRFSCRVIDNVGREAGPAGDRDAAQENQQESHLTRPNH